MINSFKFTTAPSITSFTGSAKAKLTTVCGFSITTTYYHNGSGSNPVIGDIVYTDSGGTLTLNAGFYKVGFGYISIEDLSSGEVAATGICI